MARETARRRPGCKRSTRRCREGDSMHVCRRTSCKRCGGNGAQSASLGEITCLRRGTIGEIVAAPGGAELSIDVLNESAVVAAACGYKPSEKVLSRHEAAMTAPG